MQKIWDQPQPLLPFEAGALLDPRGKGAKTATIRGQGLTPGYRATDTSQAAAEAMKPKVSVLRRMVLGALEIRPMTTMQIAHHIRQRYEATQPRTSELKDMGLIEDSGQRGISRDPRKKAIVWRIKAPG